MSNSAAWALLVATWQTIYMVYISAFLSIILGLMLGVFYFMSGYGKNFANALVNRTLGFIINTIRSIPFIILLICIIPLTRFLIGTSIGTNAAIIPLVIAAMPFYARVTESALREIPHGLIEAAEAMGATHTQLIFKVLLPEAAPALLRGACLTIISLIGYSAMAGAVGGGGLGELAINYGYQRFDTMVMLETVIILVVLVQVIQWLGDFLATRVHFKKPLIAACILMVFFVGAPFALSPNVDAKEIKVGIVAGPQEEVMQVVKKVARDRYDVNLKVIVFEDYVLPNTALHLENIDANIFQHQPYLEAQNKAEHYNLIPLAKTYVYPMGFYSHKIHFLNQLPPNATIALPNDASNKARALLLLEKAHLIQLKAGTGLLATPEDILSNPRHLQFNVLDAAQLPRVLQDADLVALTNDYVSVAGFTLDQALLKENADSPYANIIAIRGSDKNRPELRELVAAYQSPEAEAETEKLFPHGAAIPAWK